MDFLLHDILILFLFIEYRIKNFMYKSLYHSVYQIINTIENINTRIATL